MKSIKSQKALVAGILAGLCAGCSLIELPFKLLGSVLHLVVGLLQALINVGSSAAMQVAKWTPVALRKAMNALLVKECWVESMQLMVPGFHARKSATGRRYRYVIGTDEGAESPFRRPYEWALGRRLDATKLAAAAAEIRGRHDFRAFAAKGEPKPHWECDLRLAAWEARSGDQGMTFHVAADRFLHHMVRMLVGTMVDIALDRRPVADMGRLLAARENQDTSPPAPPQGLYFVAADYPAESFADLDPPPS